VCRHLAYIGPPVALRSLLFDAPHALVHQARTPRFQHAGPDNPDGWGVAWGSDPSERYRTAIPMWDDVAFSGPERAGGVLAAARYATRGSTRDARNSAPFVSDGWIFSLNGYVSGFRDGFGSELRSRLTPRRARTIEGDTDSEVVFALILDQLDVGVAPGEALADVARIVRTESPGALNLLLTDRESIYATAIDNSLYLSADSGLLVASEPLDDRDSWREIDNGSLVENDRVSAIEGIATREGSP
jgi:gamma-glutamyl hercynylcysteine S-oxide hydrolase